MDPARRRKLTLVAAIMGSFVALLDSTAVNVALPAIEDDLGGGLSGQQWVVNGYLLALGALILVGGSLADVHGERRVFAIGVGGFGAASLACAVAPSIEALVAARVLQGVFGALLTPAALAVIVTAFSGEERGRAIGSWTAWTGIAAVVGPLVGGQLVDVLSWRWVFAINVPVIAVTLALVVVALPGRTDDAPRRRVDWVGAGLSFAGLAGPVYALIRQPDLGWASPGVWGPAVAGVAVLAAFVVHESRTPHPMLPLGLFSRRNFSVGNAETLAMYAGLSVTFFFLVLHLQQVAGFSALEAGLATVPTTLVMFAFSRRVGALAERLGPRRFMGAGPLVAAAGVALLARLDADVDPLTGLLPGLVVLSVGLTLAVAPLTAAVLADAAAGSAGIASGVNNAVARVASLLGVAAVGAVVAAQFAGDVDRRLGDRELGPQARAVLAAAEDRTLSRPGPRALAGVPPDERAAVAGAATGASVAAFRTAMAIGAALLALGGLVGLLGIVDPRRGVSAPRQPGRHDLDDVGSAGGGVGNEIPTAPVPRRP